MARPAAWRAAGLDRGRDQAAAGVLSAARSRPRNRVATAIADPVLVLAHLSRQYRFLAERSAVGWQTYRDGAGVDPDIAADWRQLSDLRRRAFHAFFARLPAEALRPGLTNALAADTAWVIASPDTHDLLVCQAGYSYDELEEWVRDTLGAALLGRPERR
jgi:hypothetical protein